MSECFWANPVHIFLYLLLSAEKHASISPNKDVGFTPLLLACCCTFICTPLRCTFTQPHSVRVLLFLIVNCSAKLRHMANSKKKKEKKEIYNQFILFSEESQLHLFPLLNNDSVLCDFPPPGTRWGQWGGSGPSRQRWLHQLIGTDEGGEVMGVARGEICVFFRQLFGFQPDAGQGRRDYDLITRSHFPPET